MDVNYAGAELKKIGQKLTPQRLAILKLLMGSDKPLTAKEIYGQVRADHPNISLDTVYRNLSMLSVSGVAGQVNLQNKEAAQFKYFGKLHHHHAICLSCGKIICLSECDIKREMPLVGDDLNFKVISHAFEIYGYCSKCQKQI